MPLKLRVREADFADARDAAGIVAVLDSYASDPVGGGQPLARDARDRLVAALRDHPGAVVLLAFEREEPIGIAVCFLGFSTFRARPLLNIHDLAVIPAYRGKGVGRALLRAAEDLARHKGCCKLTLEVQDDNSRARTLYQRFGFADFVVGNSAPTRFLSKSLDSCLRIGLIGDHDAMIPAHEAIPIALRLAGDELGVSVEFEWVPTDEIADTSRVSGFSGLWCVPGSPYSNMAGALTAIRFARRSELPFLGTCGGFQHAVIEYARNVLGWADAEHAESTPEAARPVITPLACELVEASDTVSFLPGSRIRSYYGCAEATERYRCRYGLNPAFQAQLVCGPLRVGGRDAEGNVRAVELDAHPFFLATLFQPERAALEGRLPPLVAAFVGSCATQLTRQRHSAASAASSG